MCVRSLNMNAGVSQLSCGCPEGGRGLLGVAQWGRHPGLTPTALPPRPLPCHLWWPQHTCCALGEPGAPTPGLNTSGQCGFPSGPSSETLSCIWGVQARVERCWGCEGGSGGGGPGPGLGPALLLGTPAPGAKGVEGPRGWGRLSEGEDPPHRGGTARQRSECAVGGPHACSGWSTGPGDYPAASSVTAGSTSVRVPAGSPGPGMWRGRGLGAEQSQRGACHSLRSGRAGFGVPS